MTGDYYKTKESVEEYIKLAEGVHGGALIEKLKKILPSRSTLLEIGTGPGTDWNILRRDYLVTGSDNSPEFIRHLVSSYPKGRFLELDAATLKTNEKFDGIYSNKVLHHLSDPELKNSIQRQLEVLNPSGVVCHTFWKGEGSEVFKGMFVNYHALAEVRTLFQKHFEIELIETYKEFEADDSLLVIARKKA